MGLFHDSTEARACVHDLEKAGWSSDQVSLIAHRGTDGGGGSDDQLHSGTAKGAAIGGVAGAILGAVALAIPGIGPVLAIGPIAAALAGAGVGAATGGMLGALNDMGVPEREAAYWTEGVKRGGTLVVVRAEPETAGNAQDILDRHGALDIDERAQHEGWALDDPHTETANFGDEGGSSQWGRTVLTADKSRLRARMYERVHPDHRKQ